MPLSPYIFEHIWRKLEQLALFKDGASRRCNGKTNIEARFKPGKQFLTEKAMVATLVFLSM